MARKPIYLTTTGALIPCKEAGISLFLWESVNSRMSKQSYSNHSRLVWWFHGLLFGFCLATLIGSVINLMSALESGTQLYSASLLVATSILFLVFFFVVRYFGVRLQDRIIRAEENFRHMTLTGKPLDNRLRLSQVIGLRFAPDDEFVELCKEAVEKGLSQDEIKKSIRRWRGDYHRI